VKIFGAVLISMWICIPFTADADVTANDIEQAIGIGSLRHPYLFFTEDGKKEILDRIKNDTATGEIMAKLMAEGNRLLYTPVMSRISDNPQPTITPIMPPIKVSRAASTRN